MSERDKRVVENMVRTGMEPESLYASFPMFPKEEIQKIYESFRDPGPETGESAGIKLNCS